MTEEARESGTMHAIGTRILTRKDSLEAKRDRFQSRATPDAASARQDDNMNVGASNIVASDGEKPDQS